ncbi:MAG: hypothetical protein Salg2KO_17600 [Salibacteraceae bacterium]
MITLAYAILIFGVFVGVLVFDLLPKGFAYLDLIFLLIGLGFGMYLENNILHYYKHKGWIELMSDSFKVDGREIMFSQIETVEARPFIRFFRKMASTSRFVDELVIRTKDEELKILVLHFEIHSGKDMYTALKNVLDGMPIERVRLYY